MPLASGRPTPARREISERFSERKTSQAEALQGDAQALPNTDWLRHELVITGPAPNVERFMIAAAGPGSIPWYYPDLDIEADERFLALVNPPDGSLGLMPTAARVLAQELRDASFQHQQKVRGQTGVGRLCPFDLHALIPVSVEVLERGPDDLISVAWLRSNWGILQALRRVRIVSLKSASKRRKGASVSLEFWSADWTPWAAMAAIRNQWRSLTFAVRPDYGDG